MTRNARQAVFNRRLVRLLPALLLVPLLLVDDLLPIATAQPVPWHASDGEAGVEPSDESSPDGPPAPDWSIQSPRPTMRAPQRDAFAGRAPTRELLGLRPLPPQGGSRLDFCAEFTKPDSLKIRLTGTPKSHRSPPEPVRV